MKVSLRKTTKNDIVELENLDEYVFEPGKTLLQDDWSYQQIHSKIQVAVCNSRLVGYICFAERKEYLVVNRIGVHEDFRRRKIGTRLMKYLINQDKPIEVIVREDNLEYQLFLKWLGFQACKFEEIDKYVYKSFYDDGKVDAYRMVYNEQRELCYS
jgi:ribosomal protein S18 acetylase RimI-like enzyme